MEYIKLLVVITLPFLPIILWLIKKAITRNKDKYPKADSFLLSTLSLSPNNGLHAQPLFWCALAIPFIAFLTTGYFAWQDYELDISEKGFQTFLGISKLPLAIWGLCLPLAVLVSRLHSTIQTAEQILISNETAKRDIAKLKKEQYTSAKEHFIQVMNDNWKQTCNINIHELKKLEFDADKYFSLVFSGSSALKGLVPSTEQFYESLNDIEIKFLDCLHGSGWEKDVVYLKTHLARLAIYPGDMTDEDLVNANKSLYNSIVVYIKSIPRLIEQIENSCLEA